MNATKLIFETVHEELKRLYDVLVIFERGMLTELPEAKTKLIQAENALRELNDQLEACFIKVSTISTGKELTVYGKKHIINIENKAELIANDFFKSTDYSPGYYFKLSTEYQFECQRLDNHRKRGRS